MMDTANHGRIERLNEFLDQHVLPYPVKYLTNRVVILATLCMLVPLIVFASNIVFATAVNSYLNVMSVVVSSTVLLYSTISEKRSREAARRREEIAKAHTDMVEQRARTDHELIKQIHDHLDEIRAELLEHVNVSLDNIHTILVKRLETLQDEDHKHIEETHRAVLSSTESHRKELAALAELVGKMQARPDVSDTPSGGEKA
jgi:DNA anti-recombination protein RmuC